MNIESESMTSVEDDEYVIEAPRNSMDWETSLRRPLLINNLTLPPIATLNGTMRMTEVGLFPIMAESPEDSPGLSWRQQTDDEKEKYRLYLKILQKCICPICREVSPVRVLICSQCHFICQACHRQQNAVSMSVSSHNCCMCRRPYLSPVLLHRDLETLLPEIQHHIELMIGFQSGQSVDVLMETAWVEGRIHRIDFDNECYYIQVGKMTLHRCFFSDKVVKIHTHTRPWRTLDMVMIGTKMEVYVEDSEIRSSSRRGSTPTVQGTWKPGVVVYRDRNNAMIFVVYRCPSGQEQVHSYCLRTSPRIALYPTFLSSVPNSEWISIE